MTSKHPGQPSDYDSYNYREYLLDNLETTPDDQPLSFERWKEQDAAEPADEPTADHEDVE